MATRVVALARQVVPQPVATAVWPPAPPTRPFAGFESPTGKQYPHGTVASLMGNMEPVMEESAGPLLLIHGALPADLDGMFIRGGPNPSLNYFGKPDYHEFTGDGLMHACDLRGGVGTYQSRYIDTKRRTMEKEKGKPLNMGEAMLPDGSQLGQANTALVYHAKSLLALYETDKPYMISTPDLKTIGQQTFGDRLKHSVTAHPKVCPVTGELIFFGYDLTSPMMHYGVADKDGKLLRSFDVPTQSGKIIMAHDMAITSKYSLLLEFPLFFEMRRVRQGKFPFEHDKATPSRFGIFPRHAKGPEEIQWFTAESAMSFHIANAWEDGEDSITLIGCPQEYFSFDYLESKPSLLHEWKFNLKSGKTMERRLGDLMVEFPNIHPDTMGKRSRYIWTSTFAGPGYPFHSINGVVKFDLQTGRHQHHPFVGGRWGGESVFAPSKDGEEDSGYLLTYTFNPKDATTEIYVVNARTMDPNPVAILKTPSRVPFGFHGVWLSRDKL